MSTVLNAETTTADASTAPEAPAQAPVDATPSSIPFAEQQKSWTREQRDEWKLTGREPELPAAAKAPAAKTETMEPSVPNKGKTEAAPETAEDDQELPEGDTAEARRARNQMFAKMRREKAALKAERDLLMAQSKEKPARNTESAPAPKAEPKADAKPEKFTFREPGDNESWGDYQQARDEAHAEFILERAEKRVFGKMEQRKAEETAKERETRIQSEYKTRTNAALKQRDGESTEEHRTRTLQYATASRWLTGLTERAGADHIDDAILRSPVGHEVIQYFHAHQDEFAAVLKSDPVEALLAIGEVASTFKAKKTPELKPVTRTATPDPGPRVNAVAAATTDPLKEAYDQHTKTGDPKYLRIAMRLENERAAAARAR